jgi:hypothetical protein
MTTLCAVRGACGLAQLAAPGLVAQVLGLPRDQASRRVTRVLGARHLAQACLTWPAPTTAVLALGTEVDVAHAASMIGLAVIGRRWRRAALASAAVASGFAASAGVAAWQAARRPPEPPRRAGRWSCGTGGRIS